MISIVLFLLCLPLLLAPFETAGWWHRRRIHREPLEPLTEPTREREIQLVYFTGVAGYSGDFLARREKALLDRIKEDRPGLVVCHRVFPYSASNLPLDGERLFRSLWMWLHRWRLKIPNNVFDVLIVLRNIGQLLVSADPRYGPVYNEGLAEQLRLRLVPGVPTVFLAYSGGAQMAVGAAGELRAELKAPLHLVALGGVFTDDPGIEEFASVTQLVGRKDRWVIHLGKLIFPGLWKWQFWSAWNRYQKSGKFREVVSGDHCHVGKSDYFGFQQAPDTEETYGEQTAQLVGKVLQRL